MAKMLRKVFQQRSGMVAASILDTSGIKSDSKVVRLSDSSIQKPVGVPSAILALDENTTTASTKMTATSKDSNIMRHQSENLRALLVDDNEINLRLLTACVQKLHLSHQEAKNGLEALEAYKSNNGQFDVIFMGS